MFRSFYAPVSNTIDGDLCEQFSLLKADSQKQIASELDRTPAEIIKKLEDIRNRII
jgi:splicing factor 3B subunit 3